MTLISEILLQTSLLQRITLLGTIINVNTGCPELFFEILLHNKHVTLVAIFRMLFSVYFSVPFHSLPRL